MRLVQLLENFSFGDAIGNNVQTIARFARSWGWQSDIVARGIDSRVGPLATPFERFRWGDLGADALVLFHHSIGSPLVSRLRTLRATKVLLYHNVTPASYFMGVNDEIARRTAEGRRQLSDLRGAGLAGTLSDSDFNRQELNELGFANNHVVPILVDHAELSRVAPDPLVERTFGDGMQNWLFVGRIAPNKRHDDLIQLLAHYRKAIDRRVRLLLVGNGVGMDRYVESLRALALQLGVSRSVVFSGHVSEAQLAGYYRAADVFVSMSDHEGFCVPLLEAMHFGLPIVAHAAGGVPETLGGSGILARAKSWPILAEALHQVATDRELNRRLVAGGTRRVAELAPERVAGQLRECLEKLMRQPARV